MGDGIGGPVVKCISGNAFELEQALQGKFVSCNVQYRDENTDALVCNVFVQKPPEGF